MDLFPKALLAAYKAHGPCSEGMVMEPVHLYDWSTKYEDHEVSFPAALWEYLSDSPLPGWSIPYLTILTAIQEAGLNVLYVGGGSGRMAKAMEAYGLTCHCIDVSPDAIELMELRGVSCSLMDGHSMTFEDGAFPLVVIPHDTFGTNNPQGLIKEAVRVASSKVIIAGWEAAPDPVEVTETMTWQGETEVSNSWAYHSDSVETMLEDEGATVVKVVKFLSNPEFPEVSWLIEAEK